MRGGVALTRPRAQPAGEASARRRPEPPRTRSGRRGALNEARARWPARGRCRVRRRPLRARTGGTGGRDRSGGTPGPWSVTSTCGSPAGRRRPGSPSGRARQACGRSAFSSRFGDDPIDLGVVVCDRRQRLGSTSILTGAAPGACGSRRGHDRVDSSARSCGRARSGRVGLQPRERRADPRTRPVEPVGLLLDGRQRLGPVLVGVAGAGLAQAGHAGLDRGQRRPQVVRDGPQERRLHLRRSRGSRARPRGPRRLRAGPSRQAVRRSTAGDDGAGPGPSASSALRAIVRLPARLERRAGRGRAPRRERP